MPTKINMFISNGNPTPKFNPLSNINYANLSVAPTVKSAQFGLNSSMISRIHTTKPGCGSCGRK